MVTTSQLQIIQSPITSLLPTVSTAVTVKLDDTNYLIWNFQMQILLESHGILGFVDGTNSSVPAMMAQHQVSPGKALVLDEGNSHSHPSSSKSAPPPGFHGGFNGHNNGFHGSNGGYFGNRGSHFKGRGRGRHQYQFSPRPYQVPPTSHPGILGHGIDIPTCQICTKKGHVAADCYQRHTLPPNSASSIQCQICWKFGHTAVQCYHRGNFSYQGRPPSSNLSAMHAAFPPPSPPEQFWVADTGATTHMTSDLAQLNLAAPFSGADTVTTAGGSGLTISNIGSSILDVPHCSLQLKQVLHVPKLSQHLLSVHKLCKDNNCCYICYRFISCAKITTAVIFVMLLVFGFGTKSRGMFSSRDYVELGYILFLSLFRFLHGLSFQIIWFVILVNRSTQVFGTSILVILLTQSPLLC